MNQKRFSTLILVIAISALIPCLTGYLLCDIGYFLWAIGVEVFALFLAFIYIVRYGLINRKEKITLAHYYHDFEILKMALYHTSARIQMEMEVQFTVEQAPELGEIISFSGLEAAINGGEEIEFTVASSSHGGTGYSVVARNCKGYVKDFRFNHCGLVGVFYTSADKL